MVAVVVESSMDGQLVVTSRDRTTGTTGKGYTKGHVCNDFIDSLFTWDGFVHVQFAIIWFGTVGLLLMGAVTLHDSRSYHV